MTADCLTDAELGRATLARQLLLDRVPVPPLEAVRHLVGLQAQNPDDPYLALWSRLEAFDPHDLAQLLEERQVVRIVVMRGTIHLVTADDALVLRPLTQPVMDAEIRRHRDFGPPLAGIDLTPVLTVAREALAATPMSGMQLRSFLAERFPELDAGAVAYACRCYLPLVQVPPRGVWGRRSQVMSTPLEEWLGRDDRPTPSIDDVALRYLGALGPATVADMAAWSRLTGLREVVDRIRPRVRVFRGERGQELFDLPDAPRPAADVPAPVRFLPEFDNVLLSHADRARFHVDDGALAGGDAAFKGTVLVDGRVRALWRLERPAWAAAGTLVVEHAPLARRSLSLVENEAHCFVAFWSPGDGPPQVRLQPPA